MTFTQEALAEHLEAGGAIVERGIDRFISTWSLLGIIHHEPGRGHASYYIPFIPSCMTPCYLGNHLALRRAWAELTLI